MKHYTGKGRNGQDKQKKMCRKTQHVKIDIERGAPIIICRMVAVGENYNSTRDKCNPANMKYFPVPAAAGAGILLEIRC